MEFLSQHGVQFTAKNVVEDSKARDEVKERIGRMSCPVILVGGEVVAGFDRGRLASLLALPD